MKLTLLVIFSIQFVATQCELINDPTLKPADPFSASTDAGIFKKEIKDDRNTNEDKLVKIWFHRTYNQRKQIEEYYNTNFCEYSAYWGFYVTNCCPLSEGLHDISKDTLDDLYTDSLLSPAALLGLTIYQVIIGKWKEKGAIEEIVCGNDKQMKDRISEYYQSAYKDSVENQLGTFKKEDQDYQNVMKNYCWKGLCQDKKIKPEDAEKEAQALRAIDPSKDKEGFKKKLNELLDKNCEPDMKMIFEKYRNDKTNIVDAVEKAFENKPAERAYNRLVRYIEDTCKYYADELHDAVDGCGTDTDKINRIILTRCEQDLKCILDRYKKDHDKTFTNRLKMDTIEHRYLTSIRYLCGKT